MNKTLALAAIAGLSMASEIDGFADDNLSVFNLENSIRRPIFTKFHTVDDEFRVLPIVDHPRPSGPSKPIWTDDADDEFRILPIVDRPRPSGPSRPIRADDADDEFRVLPIVDHPRPSGPSKPIWTDDEFRVLPIVDHPRPTGPSKPIWTDDADDEFRILPIVDRPRPSGPMRPIRVDDADDEFRVLPIVDHPRPSGPSKPIWTDDELRILPIVDHPRPSGPAKPIRVDDADDELNFYGDGFRIHPIEDIHKNGRGQGKGRYPHKPVYRPNRPDTILADDELVYASTIPYYGNGRIQLAGNIHKTGTGQKPRTMLADDELVYANTGTYYGNSRIQLAGNIHKTGTGQKPRTMLADDELRTIPSLYSYVLNKYGKETVKKPIIEEIANDDEYHALESRLIAVGAGSLTRPKRNATETAKPLVKPVQDSRPKKNTTETVKPKPQPKPVSELPTQAADDELRFSHLFPRIPHKKNTTQEVVSSKAGDNSLLELSHLLKDLNKKGFLA